MSYKIGSLHKGMQPDQEGKVVGDTVYFMGGKIYKDGELFFIEGLTASYTVNTKFNAEITEKDYWDVRSKKVRFVDLFKKYYISQV